MNDFDNCISGMILNIHADDRDVRVAHWKTLNCFCTMLRMNLAIFPSGRGTSSRAGESDSSKDITVLTNSNNCNVRNMRSILNRQLDSRPSPQSCIR